MQGVKCRNDDMQTLNSTCCVLSLPGSLFSIGDSSGVSRIFQGRGENHGERAERAEGEPKRESEGGSRGAPSGVLMGCQGEAECFLSIFIYKSGQKLRI